MYIGIDPSLTSTGFVYLGEGGNIHSGRVTPKKMHGAPRLHYIRDSILDVVQSALYYNHTVQLVGYEDYAMGGRTSKGRLFDIGELGGVLKLAIWEIGVDVLLVPPSNLKLFATGRGTTRGKNKVEKEDIIEAVASKWGYNIPKDDEADAFILYQMAMASSGGVGRMREGPQKRALDKCQIIKGSLQAIAKS